MDNIFNTPSSQETAMQNTANAEKYKPLDILELGYDPDYLQTVDDEYLNMVTTMAPYMPKTNYNPQKQAGPFPTKNEFNPEDWFAANTVFNKPTQKNVKPTQAFSIRDTNFDRYYNHPKFSTLGFNPNRDNETYYNENSDWTDDWSRMMGQFGANFTPGFTFFGIGGNEGIFNFFDTDPDTEDAVKMAEAMRIGNSSREGFGGSFTNFALNSAYSVSIISSIAAEELALWGSTAALAAATPFTAGASGAAAVATGTAAVAKTAVNAAKFTKMLNRLIDFSGIGSVIKGGRSMVNAFKNVDKARDFWTGVKTGKNTVGRIFLPETMQALRTFEATKDVALSLHRFSRGQAAFGGFYREIRNIDLALDESRLEAGFVYNDMVSNGIREKQIELGTDNLSDKDLRDIQNAAAAASSKTFMMNAPLIYLTNRVTLGGALSPLGRGVRNIFDDAAGTLGKKILQTSKKGVVNGKTTKDVFQVKKSWWSKEGRRQRKAAYNFGDYALKGTHGALRFFAANLSEGIQELYQEAVQVGVVDYHVELLKDPAANKRLLYNAAFEKSVDSQMTEQGFETFMSGFATGSLLGGGSKVIFNHVPNTYNRVFNSEDYKTNKENKEKAVEDFVKVLNKQWNKGAEHAQSMLDTANLRFINAKQASEGQNEASYNGERLEFKDNQDFLEFIELESVLANGMIDSFRSQLKDFMKLTDLELATAFPEQASEAKNGKMKKRFQDFLNKSYEVEDIYRKEKESYPNPFNYKQFDPTSREYREELYNYQAWEHARYLKMFTKQAFNDSQKRVQGIFDSLTSDDIVYTVSPEGNKQSVKISKLGASDLTKLLDPSTINQEVGILTQEIENLEASKDQSNKKILESKKRKKQLLQNYLTVLTDPKNQTNSKNFAAANNSLIKAEGELNGLKEKAKTDKSDTLKNEITAKAKEVSKLKSKVSKERSKSRFDRRKVGSESVVSFERNEDGTVVEGTEVNTNLEKAFVKYIEFLAEENNAFADKSKVKEVLKKMVDYGELKERTKMYDKAVEMLANPEVINEVRERTRAFVKEQFLADRKNVRQRIKDAMNQDEVAQVLKDLDEEGIVPDPSEAADFLETGDVNSLQTFYTKNGEIDPLQDVDKFITIQRIKNNYNKLTEEEITDDEIIDDEITEDSTDSEKAATVINKDKTLNAFAKAIVKKRLEIINAQRVAANKKPLPLSEWQNSKEAVKLASLLADIKMLWVQSLDQAQENLGEIIRTEEGYQDWIQNNKENPDLRELVIGLGEPLGLSFNILSKDGGKGKVDKKGDKIVDDKAGVRIRKTSIMQEGKPVTRYFVEMSDGTPISEELYVAAGIDLKTIRGSYGKIAEASKVFRKLLSTIPDTASFEFAGQTLHYGSIVIDKAGKRYISIGTPAKVQPNGTLFIVPESDIEKYKTSKQREKAAVRVSAEEFTSKFSVLEESFVDSLVAKDSPKAGVDNFLRVYAMSSTLSDEDKKIALSIFLQTLTNEDLRNISIAITENKKNTTRNKLKSEDKKKENPLVETGKESHSFRLVINDPDLKNRINGKLKENGFEDGNIDEIAIMIPSGNIHFKNEAGDDIQNIFSLDESELKKYFHNPKAGLLALAKQQVIRRKILEAIAKNKSGDLSLLDIVESAKMMMSYSNAYPKDGPLSNLESLQHNTYEGEQVIIDYAYRLDPVTKTKSRLLEIRTNYAKDSDEHKALRNKVLKEISEKTLSDGTTLINYLKKRRKTDRYHAVIKTPAGNIVFAPLKSSAINEESRANIFDKLISRSDLTVEENLETKEGKTSVKSVAYNDKFNEELQEDFYISLIPGYDAELKVNARGGLELTIIDTVKDKKLESFYIDKESLGKADNLDSFLKVFGAAIKLSDATKNLKLSLSPESFKQNIPQETSAQAIALLTKTNLNPNIFSNVRLSLSVNAAEVEAYMEGMRVADSLVDDNANTKPKTKAAVDVLKQQLNIEDGVNALSEEEFNELADNDFNEIETGYLNQIATKLAAGSKVEDLSEREQQVYGVRSTFIETKANLLGASANVDSEYAVALKERDDAKIELENYVAELKAKVDSGEMTTREFTMATAGKKDATYKNLKATLDKKESTVNSFAGKIVPEEFTAKDSEDIDTFIEWANANLPEFVSIRNVSEIADRLKANGIPVGAFTMHLNSLSGGLDVGGTIYVGNKGFRYHEAFHAVFRLLLTAEEQQQYLAIAKKEVRAKLRKEGKNFKDELQKLRNSAEKYQKMSDKALEREYYEEYMADQFELFKANPKNTQTSSIIKSFFNRLVEWIKSVFSRYNKGELQRLYAEIDAGRFKSSGVQNNMFTNGLQTGVALDAYKILTYDKIQLDKGFAEKYIDPDSASKLIRTMTASYLNRLSSNDKKIIEANKKQTRQEILFSIINDYRELYNPLADHNADKSGDQIEKLNKLYTALGGTIDDSVQALTQAVDFESKAYDAITQYITLFDNKIADERYQKEEIEYDEGLRNTSQWDKDQSMIGGFSNLPMAFRAFIGTTMVTAQDEFGNTELLNGEVIYVPVDYTSAYNGLLKSVKNTTDPIEVLRGMISFAQGNTQTSAVVDRIFHKLGGVEFNTEFVMNESAETIINSITNKIFFNELINALENFRVDYIFIHRNTSRNVADNKILLYNASNRDDASNQIDVWKQAHNEKYKALRDSDLAMLEAEDALSQLYSYLNTDEKVKSIDSDKLSEISKKASAEIYEATGIKFSQSYIEYSIIANTENRTEYQQSLIDSNKTAEPILNSDLQEITNQLKLNKERQRTSAYLFTRKGGVKSRLQKLARNNALFDETIGQSVFLNPEGNFVYAHQMQTLHLKLVSKMNDTEGFLKEAKTNNEGYNLTNILLNSPAFMALSTQDRLQVIRIAGNKDSAIGATDESALSENGGVMSSKDGKTYGGLTGSEFAASLINVYLSNYQALRQQNKTVVFIDPVTGEEVETALAPVLIRVIEASNTGDLINLPIIKTVELNTKGEVTVTDNAVNLFFEEVRREYQRIQRESAKDIENKTPLDGYNAKNGVVSNDFEGRAYKFNDTATLLESTSDTENKVEAKDPTLPEETANRVLSNTQKTVYTSEAQARVIGLTVKGTSATVNINSKKESGSYVIKALGQVKVNENNIQAIVESLGDAVQIEKTKEFNKPVSIGDVTLYTSTSVLQNFLKGKTTRFAYELVEASEFKETVNQSLEFNFKSDLEKFAQQNTDATLEEAIASLDEGTLNVNSFKDIMKERLMQEYKRFRQDVDNLDIASKLSSDIKNGFTNDEGFNTGDAAMEQLNLIRGNEDYNLMQIFFNDWLNTKAINQLILGDQSISLKDAVDKVKRAKMQNASHKSAGTPVFDTNLGVNHATNNISFVAFTDPKFKRTYGQGEGDRADAQMYITTKALRHFLFGFAELDARKADLIDRIERGEMISSEELLGTDGFIKDGAVFNSLKLVYGDGQTFLKMSAVVLTPQLTTRADGTAKPQFEALHNLRLKLEKIEKDKNETLGIAAPISAAKMMKQNVVTNEKVFSEFNPNEELLPSTDLKAEYMGLQMVNPSNKLIITDPTQIKSLITSELSDDTEVYIKTFGTSKKTSIGKIKEMYHEANANRLNLKYFNKVNLIANFSLESAMRELNMSKQKGSLSIELKEFLNFAYASLKASQASSNTIEYFNPDKSYDLNNQMVVKEFEQLFLTFFAKETLSEKSPGHALALMSDAGVGVIRRVFSVDENGNPDKHEIIREQYYNSLENPPAIEIKVDSEGNLIGLADAIERSNGKGVVVLDDLRHNLKDYDVDGNYTGQRYTEGIAPAHFEQIDLDFNGNNKKLPDVVSKAFAVRIPSQDNHSALATKFIDFLPAYYGSTAIFSKELIELSGADFDIDKVYTHVKEWYKNEFGEYIEYGDLSRTDEEQFEDYIHYIAKEGRSKKSVYSQAYDKGAERLEDFQRFTDEEFELFDEATGLGKKLFISLKVLGLPTTQEAFIKHRNEKGMPYEAALNNQTLDYKYAMWSNESNTLSKEEGVLPISYEPAVLDPLTTIWDEIKRDFPVLADKVKEDGIDVDNLYGKLKAFSNNKEGAASIGAVVLPNLYLNLLGENNIEILSKVVKGQTIRQIEFNGERYNSFAETNEKIVKEEIVNGKKQKVIVKGDRTQYIISALITAMTDNAKERLAAKLGLNKDALAVVATLTKLGVPIKTSILLVNTPVIKQQYFAANNKRFKTDPGIKSRILDIMSDLRSNPVFEGVENRPVQVSDESLAIMINEDNADVGKDLSVDQADVLYSTLKQFITAHDLKSYLNNFSSVMNLSKGFGRSFADINQKLNEIKALGFGMTDEEFAAAKFNGMPLPIDARKIFKNKLWQSNLIKVLNHFNENILPNVFVSKTKTFESLNSAILKNLAQNEYVVDMETKEKISKDLLSYLNIKAYMNFLEKKGSVTLASLQNGFIYPQSDYALNIHGLVDQLRQEFPDNFFLNEFMFNENAREIENTAGIHKAESNTFGKKSDLDKLRVQAAFMELFSEKRTEATHLIHYMMVKDGLQYGAGSLLEAINPSVLDGFTSSIQDIFSMMRDGRTDLFESKFGMSYEELLNDFVFGYSLSNKNNILLHRVNNTPFYSPKQAETESLNGAVSKNVVQKNTDRLFVFADNARQLGTVGSSAVRGMDNARGLTVMYDLNTFFDADDLNSFVERFDEEINDIVNDERPVTFPKVLMSQAEVKKLKKASPDIFNYIDAKLKETFGYSLEKGLLKDSGSYSKQSINKQAIAIDLSNNVNTLTIDLYKNVKPKIKTSDEVQVKRVTAGKLNSKQIKQLARNMQTLEYFNGFKLVKGVVVNGSNTTLMEFPAVIKSVTGKTKKTVRYFKLKQVHSPFNLDQNKINVNEGVSIGSAAVYELVETKGSNYQNPIGFMFDSSYFERPSYKQVREFVESNSAEGGFIEGAVNIEQNEKDILSKATVMGYDKVFIGNEIFIDLNTFKGQNSGENLVAISEVTEEMLEENDNYGSFISDAAKGFQGNDTITEEENQVDTSDAPVVSTLNLFGALEETNLEEEYPLLVDFWNNNIEANTEAMVRLEEQNILTLEDFIAERNDPDMNYADDETFIDKINSCIL